MTLPTRQGQGRRSAFGRLTRDVDRQTTNERKAAGKGIVAQTHAEKERGVIERGWGWGEMGLENDIQCIYVDLKW